MVINKEWHLKNRMPKNPDFEEKARWHLEHQKHCSCRPIPEKLLERMKAKRIPKMKFTYTGIRVRDLERSLEFYKALGMKIVLKGKMSHGGIFVHLRSSGSEQTLELNYYPEGTEFCEEYRNGSELDHLAFWVRDVDECFRYLKGIGGTSAVEPWSEGGYRLGFLRDHDGIWLELIGLDRRKRKKKK